MTNKYANSKIYVIIDNVSGDYYIGSTTNTLKKRLQQHISEFKAWRAWDVYGDASKMAYRMHRCSMDVLFNNDYKMELVKNFPCENERQLSLEEYKVMDAYEVLGKNIVNKKRKPDGSK